MWKTQEDNIVKDTKYPLGERKKTRHESGMEQDTQTNAHTIVHAALLLSLSPLIPLVLTLRCTQKCAHAY